MQVLGGREGVPHLGRQAQAVVSEYMDDIIMKVADYDSGGGIPRRPCVILISILILMIRCFRRRKSSVPFFGIRFHSYWWIIFIFATSCLAGLDAPG